MVAGDLNNDGRTDLALIDTQSHYVEILCLDAQHRPQHAFHFKVFEEKSFTDGQQGGTEPARVGHRRRHGGREARSHSPVHDRVLVYPQDDGK